ncbi:hypothetical protein [Vibrio vulnificus]|uniref:hypothetical protein n=1 Tax=Vibrio vulnificus TaxID=672 RepID=UPI001023D540|nr:hypothetical protein [Vibrio vulnificus]RZQ33247.1 hypothetical protein D8T38_18565 [Vibrio vulnificus]HDY7776781.1 hypothetical protein [Vibrio vulnificus]
MASEKKGIGAMWKSFGEKTAFLETSTGKLLIAVLAVLMMAWSGYSIYAKKQNIEATRNGATEVVESYTLSE